MKTRTVGPVPRIIKINQVKDSTVSVTFNNGESRVIDFKDVLNKIKMPADRDFSSLKKEATLKKASIKNGTLSFDNIKQTVIFNKKKMTVPFEIGADTLYEISSPDTYYATIHVGPMIKRSREEAHLTQAQLAVKSGTTRTYISKIENDKSGIELATLKKIVEIGLGKRLEIQII